MNNCSTSVQVTVPEPVATTAPELEVGSPSVSDNSPATGATITLSATVRNAGDGAAAATTLRCPAGAPRHRPRRRPHRTPTAIAPHANAVHRRLLAQRPQADEHAGVGERATRGADHQARSALCRFLHCSAFS